MEVTTQTFVVGEITKRMSVIVSGAVQLALCTVYCFKWMSVELCCLFVEFLCNVSFEVRILQHFRYVLLLLFLFLNFCSINEAFIRHSEFYNGSMYLTAVKILKCLNGWKSFEKSFRIVQT